MMLRNCLSGNGPSGLELCECWLLHGIWEVLVDQSLKKGSLQFCLHGCQKDMTSM